MNALTEPQVRERIVGLDEAQAKAVVCALVGHSNILTFCFGYHYCARCSALVGDSLAGAFRNPAAVIVGHDCEICRTNVKALTWTDILLAPEPFAQPSASAESVA